MGSASPPRATSAPNVTALLDRLAAGELSPAKRRLVVAGVQAFGARGYHATTTRDIATAAGMSPAALYVHYPSKEELLFEVIRRGHELVLLAVREAVSGATGPRAQLMAYVRTFTYWHARQHTLARVSQDELSALSEGHFSAVAELRNDLEAVLRQLLREGSATGEFDVTDVPATALAILSLSIDVSRWFPFDDSRTPAQIGDFYAALALRMLHEVPA